MYPAHLAGSCCLHRLVHPSTSWTQGAWNQVGIVLILRLDLNTLTGKHTEGFYHLVPGAIMIIVKIILIITVITAVSSKISHQLTKIMIKP